MKPYEEKTAMAVHAMNGLIGLHKNMNEIDPVVLVQNSYAIADEMIKQKEKLEQEYLYEKAKKQK